MPQYVYRVGSRIRLLPLLLVFLYSLCTIFCTCGCVFVVARALHFDSLREVDDMSNNKDVVGRYEKLVALVADSVWYVVRAKNDEVRARRMFRHYKLVQHLDELDREMRVSYREKEREAA